MLNILWFFRVGEPVLGRFWALWTVRTSICPEGMKWPPSTKQTSKGTRILRRETRRQRQPCRKQTEHTEHSRARKYQGQRMIRGDLEEDDGIRAPNRKHLPSHDRRHFSNHVSHYHLDVDPTPLRPSRRSSREFAGRDLIVYHKSSIPMAFGRRVHAVGPCCFST